MMKYLYSGVDELHFDSYLHFFDIFSGTNQPHLYLYIDTYMDLSYVCCICYR